MVAGAGHRQLFRGTEIKDVSVHGLVSSRNQLSRHTCAPPVIGLGGWTKGSPLPPTGRHSTAADAAGLRPPPPHYPRLRRLAAAGSPPPQPLSPCRVSCEHARLPRACIASSALTAAVLFKWNHPQLAGRHFSRSRRSPSIFQSLFGTRRPLYWRHDKRSTCGFPDKAAIWTTSRRSGST